MLSRMLSNLLTNALRHGHEKLFISLKEDDSDVIFEFANEAKSAFAYTDAGNIIIGIKLKKSKA